MTGAALLRPEDLGAFFARVASAEARALLLDFDGTIAPFAADRAHASPYPGIRSRLRAIALARRATRVALVSGRALNDLRRVAALDGYVELWGSHGLERLSRDGRRTAEEPEGELTSLVDEIAADFEAARLAHVLELKPFGVAIHRRGAAAPDYESALARLRRFADAAEARGLSPLDFDGGLEWRVARSSKGLAVRAALDELGGGAAVAYLGDDRTDEDAFAALEERGLGVLVADAAHPTRARAWLRPPGELLGFLGDWLAACEGAAP